MTKPKVSFIIYILALIIDVKATAECQKLLEVSKKPKGINTDNKYGLWPGLINEDDQANGQTLLGMEEAMERIWQNQNPPDCSKAKYLLSTAWLQGFGSEVHYHGVALAFALDTGRVLLQEGGWTWRYRNEHCQAQGKHSMECYTLPLSKCTIKDAVSAMTKATHRLRNKGAEKKGDRSTGSTNSSSASGVSHFNMNTADVAPWTASEDFALVSALSEYGQKGRWSQIAAKVPNRSEVECYTRFKKYLVPQFRRQKQPAAMGAILKRDDDHVFDFISHHHIVPISRIRTLSVDPKTNIIQYELPNKDTISDTIITVTDDIILEQHKYTPNVMKDIISCLTLQEGFSYMWWRSISVTYILRPNAATLQLIDQHRDPVLRDAKGNCVSTYIRHGDKGIEMKLIPFAAYANAALAQFKQMESDSSSAGTNSNTGNSNNNKRVFFVATEDPKVFNEAAAWGQANQVSVRFSNLSRVILSDGRSIFTHGALEKSTPKNHELEYFSYLLHISEELACSAHICTVPSNTCRLYDELRGTIGGKANRVHVDLSPETCKKPPCVRHFGLANYEGPVYDPKTRIW